MKYFLAGCAFWPEMTPKPAVSCIFPIASLTQIPSVAISHYALGASRHKLRSVAHMALGYPGRVNLRALQLYDEVLKMKKVSLVSVALLIAVGVSACGTVGKGKGKGKAPVMAPVVAAPIVTKG
jgi:predicted small secreted protein